MWSRIIWFLELCDNSKASFEASLWCLIPMCSVCFLWLLFQTLCSVLTKNPSVIRLSPFFAKYKATMKVLNFLRPLPLKEMNFWENIRFVCFEVVFQEWVLYIGRKRSQITQRNYLSNIKTWWHSNSSWRLYLRVLWYFTISFPWESAPPSQSASPGSNRESFVTSFHDFFWPPIGRPYRLNSTKHIWMWHWNRKVTPSLTQPFILLRSIKWVSQTCGDFKVGSFLVVTF